MSSMAASKNLFLASLLLAILLRATAQCPEGKLDIAVVETGRTVAGKREWKVTVTNICFCTQSNLVLNCPDFSTAEAIDYAVFRQVDHGHCLVRGGEPIHGDETVTFKYAADRQTRFSYSSSTISCS
ncbi:TPD1 protein homolog 1-like [Nymphaea colorata]|nr:TPD1 protein homolog 1-like [Nymphaea colorata]